MSEFKRFHPIVNLIYFAFVIMFAMVYMNPLCLGISFVSGLTYSIMLGGKKAAKFNLIYMLPLMIAAAVINPVFNHRGVTVLGYFPGGNPLTMESVLYGFAAAVMVAAVICHFSCFNKIMTSDKLIYLFGRIIPSLSLIFTMTLRFVPKFALQLKTVANAQKGIGKDLKNGSIISRAKKGLSILSVMTSWALENSIETADSMKSRGYGLGGRTTFSNFKFDKRDLAALIFIVAAGIYFIVGAFAGAIKFEFFPVMSGAEISAYGISVFIMYFALNITPVIIECREEIKWKLLKRKI